MTDRRRRSFFLALTLAVAASLAACATPEAARGPEEAEIDAEPHISGEATLYGTWADGQVHTLLLDEDNTFVWNRPRRCSAPPCPVQRIAGIWRVQDGTLVIDPATEEPQRYRYEMTRSPRMLLLTTDDGEEVWRFGYAAPLR